MATRTLLFALFLGLTSALLWTPLSMLAGLSLREEHHSHLLLVPLISAALFFLGRERIFARLASGWRAGIGLVLGGGFLYSLNSASLSLSILAVVSIWVGGFVLCYGLRALRAGIFPALFLLLMVPVPDIVLTHAIGWLQHGSAEVSAALFHLAGAPVLRSGFTFELPAVTVEVAEECSGIRSSVALMIVSLLVGHLFLRSAWAKALLMLVTLPLLVVKNGIRIVTLSLLANYVDPSILAGSLHRKGGVLFFLLALGLLAPAVALLQRAERAQAIGPYRSVNTTSTQ